MDQEGMGGRRRLLVRFDWHSYGMDECPCSAATQTERGKHDNRTRDQSRLEREEQRGRFGWTMGWLEGLASRAGSASSQSKAEAKAKSSE